MTTPNSYKDPYWLALADQTEKKLGIPPGLLGNIITKGERSNNDQVSEAGARTVAQIIPSTRDAVLKKYGVDAYLSPETAVEAAGLVLKEGLDRNGGDAAAAVAEYHGGVKRENWGPKTKAYVQRVTGSKFEPVAGQSTYARIKAQREAEAPQTASIASVLDAYQSGQMAPEDAAQFEKDVNDGLVVLPQGRTLKPEAPKAAPSDRLPEGVVRAYLDGRMSAEDKAQLDRDIASGAVDVPDGYGQYFKGSKAKTGAQLIEQQVQASAPPTPRRETTLGEDVVGVGEAALTAATGATTGTIGTIAGGVSQAVREAQAGQFGTPQAAQRIAAQAMQGAQAGTYEPRTLAGQRSAQALAEVAEILPPVVPLADQLGMAARAARPAAQAAVTAGRAAVPAAVQRVQQAAAPIQRAAQAVTAPLRREDGAVFGGGKSIGAAETPVATQRRATAESMPVPFVGKAGLMKGQASREQMQRAFEIEQAKTEAGAPIRERVSNQREVLEQNFDALVDVANPQFLETPEVGKAVDRAITNRANVAMRKISDAYRQADEAGELAQPVDMTPIIAALDDAERFPGSAPLVQSIRREAQRFGALVDDGDGGLVAGRIPIRDAEAVRQFINDKRTIDWTNPKEAAIGRIIKDGIDQATEAAGGDLYRQARAMRRAYAEEFENTALTKKLLGTKRGTDERQIAVEDIYDRVIVKSSVEEMNKLRATLLRAGDEGKQAWANLKAKAIDDIKEKSMSASQLDERGNPTMSPDKLNRAIAALDKDGKLEALYGKRQAQTIRDLGDIANVIFTAPPGAINTSNTASALKTALDAFGTFAFTGVPVPAVRAINEAAKYAKDRKLRARIQDALRPPENPQTTSTGKF